MHGGKITLPQKHPSPAFRLPKVSLGPHYTPHPLKRTLLFPISVDRPASGTHWEDSGRICLSKKSDPKMAFQARGDRRELTIFKIFVEVCCEGRLWCIPAKVGLLHQGGVAPPSPGFSGRQSFLSSVAGPHPVRENQGERSQPHQLHSVY